MHGSCSQKSWLSPVRAASRQERRAKAALKRSGFYLLHLDRQIFWKQGFKLTLTKWAHHFNRHTRCKLGPRPAPSREEVCFGKQTQDGKRDASTLQQPQGKRQSGIYRPFAAAEMPRDITMTQSLTQAASHSTELCRGCWQTEGDSRLVHRNHLRAEDLVPQGLQSINQVKKIPHAQGSKFSSSLLDCRD